MAERETNGELSLGALLAAVGGEAAAGNADGREPEGAAASSPLDTLRGIGWNDEAPIRLDGSALAVDDRAEEQAGDPFDLIAALGYRADEAFTGKPEAGAGEDSKIETASVFSFSIAAGEEPAEEPAVAPEANAEPSAEAGPDGETEPEKPIRKGRFADIPVHRPAAVPSDRTPAAQEVRDKQPAAPDGPEQPAPDNPELLGAPDDPEPPAVPSEAAAPASQSEPKEPAVTRKLPRVADAAAPVKRRSPAKKQPAASAKPTPAKTSIAAGAHTPSASLPSAKLAPSGKLAASGAPASTGKPASSGHPAAPMIPCAPALPPSSAPAVLPAVPDAAISTSEAPPAAMPQRARLLRRAATVLAVLAAAVLVCAIGLFVAGFGAPSSDGDDTKTPASAEGAAPTGPSSAVYRYQVSGPDGAVFSATETASFDGSGLLKKSVIAVEAADPDVAQRYLDDMKAQFGSAFLGGGVNGSTVTLTLAADDPAPTRDAYTELLMKNAADCEVVG